MNSLQTHQRQDLSVGPVDDGYSKGKLKGNKAMLRSKMISVPLCSSGKREERKGTPKTLFTSKILGKRELDFKKKELSLSNMFK